MSAGNQALELEPGIDFRRWRDAVLAHRWFVVAGLVVGLVLGGLYSLRSSNYEATVTIKPAQPYNPQGNPINSFVASPLAMEQVVTSDPGLRYAAAAAHMPWTQLRGHVTTSILSVGSSPQPLRGVILIQVSVSLPRASWAQDAANALGAYILRQTEDPYVKRSIAIYSVKEATLTRRLNVVTNVIAQYGSVLAAGNLTSLHKLELVAVLDDAISRQGSLQNNLIANERTRNLAENLELPQIVNPAVAAKPAAPSRRNSLIFGGLIGLMVAGLGALIIGLRQSPDPRAA